MYSSWICLCCPTCHTCPGAHAVSAKLIYICSVRNYWAQGIERAGGLNIFMSGFVAPYFSPGSARVVFILGIRSPLLGNCPSCFEWTCASARGLGDCAHARDVVLARASMTCVAQALYFCVYAHECIRILICSILWSGLFPFSALVCDLLPRRLLDGFC